LAMSINPGMRTMSASFSSGMPAASQRALSAATSPLC
jgi:hypothetical protein